METAEYCRLRIPGGPDAGPLVRQADRRRAPDHSGWPAHDAIVARRQPAGAIRRTSERWRQLLSRFRATRRRPRPGIVVFNPRKGRRWETNYGDLFGRTRAEQLIAASIGAESPTDRCHFRPEGRFLFSLSTHDPSR